MWQVSAHLDRANEQIAALEAQVAAAQAAKEEAMAKQSIPSRTYFYLTPSHFTLH